MRGAVVHPPPRDGSTGDAVLPKLLRAARRHLGMEVSFISEFRAGERVFRYVEAEDEPLIRAGDGGPLEESYCVRVVDGRMPRLIKDAQRLPAALELPVTAAVPVGAHVSAPLILSDGSVYGTFCCVSRHPDESLTTRDLAVVEVFASIAVEYLEADRAAGQRERRAFERIADALALDGCLTTVLQPIVALDHSGVVGFEALSRFQATPRRSPDVWFAEAERLGLGTDLEIRAVRSALALLPAIPAPLRLGINVSPAVAQSEMLRRTLADVDLRRITLEMTEHAPVDDYRQLDAALRPLRDQGLHIAVDDAGAGYASLRHILWLTPDSIKLDLSITRDIDTDSAKAALAAALIEFARKVGSGIIAEGIETAAEARTLHSLGAASGQGYHLGRPADPRLALADLAGARPL